MNIKDAIKRATEAMRQFHGQAVDVLELRPPTSIRAARTRMKYVSKLSSFLANIMEEQTVETLNAEKAFENVGTWIRQDPGFPDVLLDGKIEPKPGLEVKLWYPLSTEVTARFRDSQAAFADDQTYVVLVAWVPEFLVYGKPVILEVVAASARSIAEARDVHYHNPPDYLVVEPNDTKSRTRNLQQTNTTGHKFQGSEAEFARAEKLVESWGRNGLRYSTDQDYQDKVDELKSKFRYRLDTNYAKIDRIVHPGIEGFKTAMLAHPVQGLSISEWMSLFHTKTSDAKLEVALRDRLGLFKSRKAAG